MEKAARLTMVKNESALVEHILRKHLFKPRELLKMEIQQTQLHLCELSDRLAQLEEMEQEIEVVIN